MFRQSSELLQMQSSESTLSSQQENNVVQVLPKCLVLVFAQKKAVGLSAEQSNQKPDILNSTDNTISEQNLQQNVVDFTAPGFLNQLFHDFITFNVKNCTDERLRASLEGLQLIGTLNDYMMLAACNQQSLDRIRGAWCLRMIQDTPTFKITQIGEIEPVNVKLWSRSEIIPIDIALLESVSQLNRQNIPATTSQISCFLSKMHHTKILPSAPLVCERLTRLVRERKLIRSGSTYLRALPEQYQKSLDSEMPKTQTKFEERRSYSEEVLSQKGNKRSFSAPTRHRSMQSCVSSHQVKKVEVRRPTQGKNLNENKRQRHHSAISTSVVSHSPFRTASLDRKKHIKKHNHSRLSPSQTNGPFKCCDSDNRPNGSVSGFDLETQSRNKKKPHPFPIIQKLTETLLRLRSSTQKQEGTKLDVFHVDQLVEGPDGAEPYKRRQPRCDNLKGRQRIDELETNKVSYTGNDEWQLIEEANKRIRNKSHVSSVGVRPEVSPGKDSVITSNGISVGTTTRPKQNSLPKNPQERLESSSSETNGLRTFMNQIQTENVLAKSKLRDAALENLDNVSTTATIRSNSVFDLSRTNTLDLDFWYGSNRQIADTNVELKYAKKNKFFGLLGVV